MRKRRRVQEIDPEDILLDASNLPSFDTHQFEGKLVKPIEKKTFRLFVFAIATVFLVLVGQSFFLQVVKGNVFAQQSAKNRLSSTILFAQRGTVKDRNGNILVDNVMGSDVFPIRKYITPGFAHILGYVKYPGRDSKGFLFSEETDGVSGAEKVFDDSLKGSNGLRLVEEDALGNVVSNGTVVNPIPGKSITLSIDEKTQQTLYADIKDIAESSHFLGGSGVIMNVNNGEILALTNYPEFDPNILSDGEDRKTISSYIQSESRPFLNRATSGQYAPGSVMKPFVALEALTEGVVTPSTGFVSTGSISVPNPFHPDQPSIFYDWRPNGYVDVERALAVSSNIYFYIVSGGFKDQKGIGIEGLQKVFALFGFGKDTGIKGFDESPGFIPSPEWKEKTFGDEWRVGDTYYTAIGQYAVTVTPLQMVRGIAAIANGGTLETPTVIKGEHTEGKKITIDTDALHYVREGMDRTVTEGTAEGANVSYLKYAAKTGTAQVGISKDLINSWIVGYFPADDPKYAFAIVMEKGPKDLIYGGVAVWRKFLDAMHSIEGNALGI